MLHHKRKNLMEPCLWPMMDWLFVSTPKLLFKTAGNCRLMFMIRCNNKLDKPKQSPLW